MTGKKWSEKGQLSAVTGAMELLVIDPAQANASNKNGRILISQLKDYLMGQLPPDPEGVSWTTAPQVSYEDSTVTIGAGEANWSIVATTYSGTVFPVTLPAQGLIRRDLFAAKSDGTYVYVEGVEGSVAIDPPLPAGTLFVRYILFSAQGGVVEQPPAGALITPYNLSDAATVQVDGTKSVNFELNLPATPLLQTLSFVNTEHGGDYRVVINNCSGQTVTIGAVSGVAYTDYRGNVRTSLTLPASGKCVVLYYHESASVRQVVTLDSSGIDGDYLPLSNPNGAMVTYGTDGSLELYEDGFEWEDYDSAGAGYYLNGEANAYIPGKGVFGALMRLLAVKGSTQAGVIPYVTETGEHGVVIRTDNGSASTDWDFRQDGKLYINGVEFSGGSGGSVTGEASAESASSLLTFTNPFGHIRTTALSGNITFTKSGAVLGSTVVQPVTSDGTNTLTFDFAHYILNSDFVSGSSLAAGEYELYFSNRGSEVAISIASKGSSGTTIPNSAPTANAGSDQTITLPTNSVTLSGSGTDSDGTIASYSWSKVAGGSATITDATAASTTVTGLTEGTYTFRLTVTDNEGATATDDVTVTVNAQAATQLNAPTGLTATASGQNQINLSWTDTNA